MVYLENAAITPGRMWSAAASDSGKKHVIQTNESYLWRSIFGIGKKATFADHIRVSLSLMLFIQIEA